MNLVETSKYRNDIDGLRAIAVLAAMFFHFGCLPNGYLGVDIFFVISGYLITGILYKELKEGRFSVANFYLRRTRRILPLTLFVAFASLPVGVVTMLPDDLENLSQSIIATNLFGNNILQLMTTKNYWDVVNEFKPLMHTWSLGIEEQYYFFYPLLFLFFGRKRHKFLLPLLVLLTLLSLFLYLSPLFSNYEKFYLIHFRFYELAVGGVAAIFLKNRLIYCRFSYLFIFAMLAIICIDYSYLPSEIILLSTVFLTVLVLSVTNNKSYVSRFILENRLMKEIGLLSFSLYMWHQVILAYFRYILSPELNNNKLLVVFFITIVLSLLSYNFIEKPFRNLKIISTPILFSFITALFLITTLVSCYIYINSGVLKDVPELDILKSEGKRNMHATYNNRAFQFNKPFDHTDKINVLVVGDSFARDWTNILLESKYSDEVEILYISSLEKHKNYKEIFIHADVVFWSRPEMADIQFLDLDKKRIWAVGTKNFGVNNGVFYNYTGDNYYEQRTPMEKGYLQKNRVLSQLWGPKYIDIIALLVDEKQEVPVFTPDHKFISQDCRHLTKAGALFLSSLLEDKLGSIFESASRTN